MFELLGTNCSVCSACLRPLEGAPLVYSPCRLQKVVFSLLSVDFLKILYDWFALFYLSLFTEADEKVSEGEKEVFLWRKLVFCCFSTVTPHHWLVTFCLGQSEAAETLGSSINPPWRHWERQEWKTIESFTLTTRLKTLLTFWYSSTLNTR